LFIISNDSSRVISQLLKLEGSEGALLNEQ